MQQLPASTLRVARLPVTEASFAVRGSGKAAVLAQAHPLLAGHVGLVDTQSLYHVVKLGEGGSLAAVAAVYELQLCTEGGFVQPMRKEWCNFQHLPDDGLLLCQRGSARILFAQLPLCEDEFGPVFLFGSHDDAVLCMATNRELLLSGGADGCVRLWSLDNGSLLDCCRRQVAVASHVTAVSFVGPLLVAAGMKQGSVCLYDISTSRLVIVQRFTVGEGPVTGLVSRITPQQVHDVVTAAAPRGLDGGGVLSGPVGLPWRRSPIEGGKGGAAAGGGTDTLLAVSSASGWVNVFRASRSGENAWQVVYCRAAGGNPYLSFSPDGNYMAVGAGDRLEVLHADSFEVVHVQPFALCHLVGAGFLPAAAGGSELVAMQLGGTLAGGIRLRLYAVPAREEPVMLQLTLPLLNPGSEEPKGSGIVDPTSPSTRRNLARGFGITASPAGQDVDKETSPLVNPAWGWQAFAPSPAAASPNPPTGLHEGVQAMAVCSSSKGGNTNTTEPTPPSADPWAPPSRRVAVAAAPYSSTSPPPGRSNRLMGRTTLTGPLQPVSPGEGEGNAAAAAAAPTWQAYRPTTQPAPRSWISGLPPRADFLPEPSPSPPVLRPQAEAEALAATDASSAHGGDVSASVTAISTDTAAPGSPGNGAVRGTTTTAPGLSSDTPQLETRTQEEVLEKEDDRLSWRVSEQEPEFPYSDALLSMTAEPTTAAATTSPPPPPPLGTASWRDGDLDMAPEGFRSTLFATAGGNSTHSLVRSSLEASFRFALPQRRKDPQAQAEEVQQREQQHLHYDQKPRWMHHSSETNGAPTPEIAPPEPDVTTLDGGTGAFWAAEGESDPLARTAFFGDVLRTAIREEVLTQTSAGLASAPYDLQDQLWSPLSSGAREPPDDPVVERHREEAIREGSAGAGGRSKSEEEIGMIEVEVEVPRPGPAVPHSSWSPHEGGSSQGWVRQPLHASLGGRGIGGMAVAAWMLDGRAQRHMPSSGRGPGGEIDAQAEAESHGGGGVVAAGGEEVEYGSDPPLPRGASGLPVPQPEWSQERLKHHQEQGAAEWRVEGNLDEVLDGTALPQPQPPSVQRDGGDVTSGVLQVAEGQCLVSGSVPGWKAPDGARGGWINVDVVGGAANAEVEAGAADRQSTAADAKSARQPRQPPTPSRYRMELSQSRPVAGTADELAAAAANSVGRYRRAIAATAAPDASPGRNPGHPVQTAPGKGPQPHRAPVAAAIGVDGDSATGSQPPPPRPALSVFRSFKPNHAKIVQQLRIGNLAPGERTAAVLGSGGRYDDGEDERTPSRDAQLVARNRSKPSSLPHSASVLLSSPGTTAAVTDAQSPTCPEGAPSPAPEGIGRQQPKQQQQQQPQHGTSTAAGGKPGGNTFAFAISGSRQQLQHLRQLRHHRHQHQLLLRNHQAARPSPAPPSAVQKQAPAVPCRSPRSGYGSTSGGVDDVIDSSYSTVPPSAVGSTAWTRFGNQGEDSNYLCERHPVSGGGSLDDEAQGPERGSPLRAPKLGSTGLVLKKMQRLTEGLARPVQLAPGAGAVGSRSRRPPCGGDEGVAGGLVGDGGEGAAVMAGVSEAMWEEAARRAATSAANVPSAAHLYRDLPAMDGGTEGKQRPSRAVKHLHPAWVASRHAKPELETLWRPSDLAHEVCTTRGVAMYVPPSAAELALSGLGLPWLC